ncbi:MAG: PQQ-binding-like beta-propeller repeat protein [Planctomycetota bacterium]|jgi:outer membrane protein assembly factor BamB
MKRSGFFMVILALAFAGASAALAGEESAWPCFHGPKRNNQSAETGLLQAWHEGGPKLVWKATGLGHGFSSVAVAKGCIFTAGMTDQETTVYALDLTGKEVWKQRNGASWQASKRQRWAVRHAGSRGTPTIDGDTVYHLADMGQLTAFDFASGDVKWRMNIMETFKAPRPKYGYSESVLILGDRLICSPGGKEGFMVALDKKDGRTVWANTSLQDPIGYSSPVPAVIDGVEQIIGTSAAHVFAVKKEDGKFLWKVAFGNKRNNNITDPIVFKDHVFVSSGYGKGSALLRPRRGADGGFPVETIWSTELLDNHHGGVLLLDGFLYGAGHEAKGWFCLEWKSGAQRWQSPGKGSLTYADGCLYCLDKEGTFTLIRKTPEKWDAAGSFQVPKGGRGYFWAHPVVCGGRLYVRHSETLYAYAIAKE